MMMVVDIMTKRNITSSLDLEAADHPGEGCMIMSGIWPAIGQRRGCTVWAFCLIVKQPQQLMSIMMVVMPVIVTVHRAAAHEDAACRAKLR